MLKQIAQTEELLISTRDNLAAALAQPSVVKELQYLDKGIGTATNSAVWLKLRENYRSLCEILPPETPSA